MWWNANVDTVLWTLAAALTPGAAMNSVLLKDIDICDVAEDVNTRSRSPCRF